MNWPWSRVCVFWWALTMVVVAVSVARPNKAGRLYPTFAMAGEHFWHAEPLYGPVPEHLDQFRYSPLAALLFSPWHHLPPSLGGVLWRSLQAIAFLLGLRAWAKVAHPPVSWPPLALFVLPLAIGNVFNAQINLCVAALILFSTVAMAERRYWWVALGITLATMFKVYPLAVGLLFVLLEPKQLAPRFAITLLLAGLFPYALHERDYINQQFADWFARLGSDDRTHWPLESGYHDAHKLLRRWGLTIPLGAYRVLELLAGIAFAGWVWQVKRHRPPAHALHTAFVLGSIWCTLFGPATETPTYVLLAAAVVQALVKPQPTWSRYMVGVVYVLLLSVPISYWFPAHVSNPFRTLIPQAHAALLFLLWLVISRSCVGGNPPRAT